MKRNICIIGLLMSLILSVMAPITLGELTTTTELDISAVQGSIGAVIVTVENVGEETAEKVVISTHVSGGILGGIDLSHECSGCSACGSSLDAGQTKTESTAEAGYLVGFGPIVIDVSASAENADEVTGSYNGFLIGPVVLLN